MTHTRTISLAIIAVCYIANTVAVYESDNGVTYSMYQDGDLWLVPTDHDWSEE